MIPVVEVSGNDSIGILILRMFEAISMPFLTFYLSKEQQKI